MPSRSRSRSFRSRSNRRSSQKVPKSVLVKNLSSNTTIENLRDGFGRYGPVKDIYMPRDYHSGRPRGIAFIEFEDGEHADDAVVDMDNTRIQDNYISCCIAKDRRKSPQTMRRMMGGPPPRSKSRGRGRARDSRSRGRDSRSRDSRRRESSRMVKRERKPERRGKKSFFRTTDELESRLNRLGLLRR